MNNIGQQQNNENFLLFQYSARYYYNRAEILNYLVWAMCIMNAILCNLSFSMINHLKAPITFGFAIVSMVIQVMIKKCIEIASSMRKYIDYHLFEFPIPSKFNNYSKDKLTEFAIKVREKKPEKALEQFKNTGTDEPRGVKDWYTNINPDDSKTTAILVCQKQNVWWDRKLSDIYIKLIGGLVGFLFVILMVVFFNDEVIDMLWFLMSISTLIVKTILEYLTISGYKRASISIETLLETSPNKINSKYLMDIQNRIDQRRSMPFLTSNLLHRINTKKFHAILEQLSK